MGKQKQYAVPAATDVIGWHVKECQVWGVMLRLAGGDRPRALACWEDQISAIRPPPDVLGLKPRGYG